MPLQLRLEKGTSEVRLILSHQNILNINPMPSVQQQYLKAFNVFTQVFDLMVIPTCTNILFAQNQ